MKLPGFNISSHMIQTFLELLQLVACWSTFQRPEVVGRFLPLIFVVRVLEKESSPPEIVDEFPEAVQQLKLIFFE